MKNATPQVGASDRTQVNVRLPKQLLGELMRYAGLEQAASGHRVSQQELIERALTELVASLRAKHG